MPAKRRDEPAGSDDDLPRPAPSKRPEAAKAAAAPAKSPPRSGRVPEGAGDCGLVLPRISNDSLRQKAAELISEIKGVGVEDAMRLTERTIIPVLAGVSRDVAEFHKEKFERNKISARVTTRSGKDK
jgi:hypothetical protein